MPDGAGQGQQAASVGDRRDSGHRHRRRAVDLDDTLIVADRYLGQPFHRSRSTLEMRAQPGGEAVEQVAHVKAIADGDCRPQLDEVRRAGTGERLVDAQLVALRPAS
jgi:hypothetical protein